MVPFAIDTSLLWLVTAAVVLLAVVVAVMALQRAGRVRRELTSRCEALEKQVAQLKASSLTMGQRLLTLEKRQVPPSAASDKDTPQGYREASHLLAAGISPEEVASRCGLSRAEASLLDALRKRDASRG